MIDLDLTPGIAVAQSIIVTIDRDGDGTISSDEQQAYADAVMRALEIRLDGKALPLGLISSTFPDLSAFCRGEGIIWLQIGAAHPGLSPGAHQLFFRNAHRGSQSVYLANALVPESPRVAVAGQRRDEHQRELTIDYSVRAESAGSARAWILVIPASAGLMMMWLARRTRASRS